MDKQFYPKELVASSVGEALMSRFPGEQFLPEELNGVYEAIVNSLRWAAIREAKYNSENGGLFKLELLETTDRFCTERMTREEIVARIKNTSGLDVEMSAAALSTVESIVDSIVYPKGDEPAIDLLLEFIGTIKGLEGYRYSIELTKQLSISPRASSATNVPKAQSTGAA
jgi:hypothetical protein